MTDPLAWAARLFRAFYAEGVRHIYFSPGSRSTPLVMGAAIHPGFHHHVVLDERSAAFQALGSGKATGVPSLLVCTSGTAVANYWPAVVESRHSGIPLIVLSADRPPHMRGSGSSQTIDQLKLFGDTVLMFHELGEPASGREDLERLDLLARQSVGRAIHSGGPVHLNAAFRKPLEPSPESLAREEKRAARQMHMLQEKADRPLNPGTGAIRRESFSEEIIRLINRSKRPLILAGPDEPFRSLGHLAGQLAARLRIPIIVEPGGQVGGQTESRASFLKNIIDHYSIFLGTNKLNENLKPDLIFRIGSRPFTSPSRLIESCSPDVPVIHLLSRDHWEDVFHPKSFRITLSSSEISNIHDLDSKDDQWLNRWQAAGDAAGELLGEVLSGDAGPLTDGHVFYYFSMMEASNWQTMCSNSMTIRDLALFSAGSQPLPLLFTNRGAAGIDGIVSTGIGISRAGGRPVRIYTGDLALLHDSNALLGIRELEQRIVLIVINNGGGAIFRHLPVNDGSERFRRFFETPQKADLASLARMHGMEYRFVDSIRSLKSIDNPFARTGKPLMIECRTDPDRSMKLRKALLDRGEKLPDRRHP